MSDLNNENLEEIENIDLEKSVEEPIIRLKTKPIPIIIVLLASAISCVISIIQFVDFGTFFIRLLQSVIIFGIIGCFVKIVLDIIFNKKADKAEAYALEKANEDNQNETEPKDSVDSDETELTEEEGTVLDEDLS